MNRLVVCMGAYAKIPYRIEYIKMDIYCIEEFCYYLCEYTNLLDQDLMDEELVRWIKEQCELQELALLLQEHMEQKKALSVFVGIILRYVHFADEVRVQEIQHALEQSDGLNPLERKKQRADNLFLEKKYYFGLDLYHQLLREIPVTEKELLTKVLHNCGMSYANLFYFETALELFERAYKLSGEERIKQACLYCRMNLFSHEEYKEYVAEHPEFYEASLVLEREIQESKAKWNSTEEKHSLNSLFKYNENKNFEEDRAFFDEKLDVWEKEYMTMVRL